MLSHASRLTVFGVLSIAMIVLGGSAGISRGDRPADETPTLFPGVAAPAIQAEEFVKGKEVASFTPGHVYVVEFWATWCGPCVERFGHLSEIQRVHRDEVTIVGVNIWEEKEYSEKTLAKVREFVKGQGDRMLYSVAYDGAAGKTASAYMQAAQQSGIPTAFIVDRKGRIAWIGHPAVMETPLEAVLRGTFDIESSKAKFNESIARRAKGRAERAAAQPMMKKWSALWDEGRKDEALPVIAEFVDRWPRQGSDAAYKAIQYMLTEKQDSAGAKQFADHLIDIVYKDDSIGLYIVASAIVDPEIKTPEASLDTARRAIDRSIEIETGSKRELFATLARVQFLKGDAAAAVASQETAIGMVGNDVEAKKELEADLQKYRAAAAGNRKPSEPTSPVK